MNFKKGIYLYSFIIILIINNCDTITGVKNSNNESSTITTSLNGYAQKGPYVQGSAVQISELDSNLSQTGRIFNTQINSDDGKIKLDTVELKSSIVQIKVNGYYFNEILGDKSDAQLTLYSISDVTDTSSINVNLLTTLERQRVNYLLSQGQSFQSAKRQAQEEILSAFNISINENIDSDQLSIDDTSNADGALLAVSLILTGYRTNAEITQLLSRISSDFKMDGTLDNPSLQSNLINHAKFLQYDQIKENLNSYYSNLGKSINVANFTKHLDYFIENTGYEFTGSPINYPEDAEFGKNILHDSVSTISAETSHSLQAVLPKGSSLEIKIISPTDRVEWGMSTGDKFNVRFGPVEGDEQLFDFIDEGKCFAEITFYHKGEFEIEYYEMSDSVTKTKTLTVE